MAKPKLTTRDFETAAKRLRCEVAAIRAVAEVESRGEGFYSDGFPVILFERHIFYKYCDRARRAVWTRQHPTICNPKAGGYGAAGQNQRNKFNLAFSLDPIAAMKSCSWGKFQIMGFNHEICGFETVGAFVDAMKESEGNHLMAFVEFVKSVGLAEELRSKDWARFARGYNGAGYKKNRYDEKMATFYAKFSKQKNSAAANIVPAGNTAGVTTDDSSRETPIENQPTAEANQTQTETTQNAENITNVNTAPPSAVPPDFVPEDKPIAAPVKEGTTTTATTVTIAGLVVPPALVGIVQAVQSAFEKGYIDAKQVFDAVLNLLTNNLRYVPYLIGLIVLILIIKKVFKQVSFLLQMYLTASPDKNNPIIVPTVPETSKLTLAQRLTGRI
jgi:hypothetical protein